MMSSSSLKIDDLIKDLEDLQKNGDSCAKDISNTIFSLYKTINKLKREKNKIDPRNCADCNTRRQSLVRKLFGGNKKPTLEQQNEFETVYTDLKITKDEKRECEKELEITKMELKKAIKERDNIVKQHEIQTEANAVLVETLGENRRDHRKMEITQQSNDQLKAKNENLTKSLNELENEKEKLIEDIKLQKQKYESSLTEIEELKDKIKKTEKEAEVESERRVYGLKREIEELKTKMKISEDEHDKTVNALRRQIKEMENKAKVSEAENERNVSRLQVEVTQLNKSLSSKTTEITDLKRQNSKYVHKSSQTEEKNGALQKLRDEVNDLKSELEEKERAKQNMDKINKDLNEELERRVNKHKFDKDEILHMDCRVTSLEAELGSFRSKCIELETEKNMLTESKKLLQKHIDGMKSETSRLNQENSELKQELTSHESNLEVMVREKEQLKTDALDNGKVVVELQTLKVVLTSELERLKRENEKLVQQIQQLTKKQRRLIELSVVSSMKQGLTDIVMHDLNGKLKQISDTEDIDIVLRPTGTAPPSATGTNIKGPTIVFCISLSRLGSDVQEALKGISVSSDVAIIIFHHKEAHALPSQSSEKILTGSEYKQLGSIIDMAVLSSKGIYNCDMNSLGFSKLITFAKRFMK